ncbi:MAG: tRNA guanosine(34) transglycosylase Tgt [Deltaproteobacteria bacterium]|nr:tRNA guanosine(34) transglycosylase Tgt [Deltaproteobacteria bacterium]
MARRIADRAHFQLIRTAPSGARAGVLRTRFGPVETPTFMPVATHANARPLSADEVAASGASIVLANTWHLFLRPGVEVFRHFGGIHRFMGWPRGVLTDSGGFQIFSLEGERELTEAGARFNNPWDATTALLTPELSMEIQHAIGSDIAMVLDECVDATVALDVARAAMERTHRWALRSLARQRELPGDQALFAIVQGGVHPSLRTESAAFLTEHPFDGFAIGGLAVGERRDQLYATAELTAARLPAEKARYLMGVGTPIDLVECVRVGCDLFDCILPTKMAQQGYAYTFAGQLRVGRSDLALADRPLEAGCDCPACTRYALGFVHHLVRGGHAYGVRLLAQHNLHHYQRLMRRLRGAILEDRLESEVRALRDELQPRKAVPKGLFEVVGLRTGVKAIRHTGHGEVMHPGIGPDEEARRLYADQVDLRGMLGRPGGPLRILDIGLGAAANASAAIACAREAWGPSKRVLEIVSLESHLEPLELALADPAGFPYLEPLLPVVRTLLDRGTFEDAGLRWTVRVGDARTAIGSAGGGFELVYFDPFSPEKNPDLWTRAFLSSVRAQCADDARLVTYSAATPSRVALLLAGFYVGTGISTGLRAETTVAATRPELLAAPLGARWTKRWERSTARAPHGEPWSASIDDAVRAHPQFAPLRTHRGGGRIE